MQSDSCLIPFSNVPSHGLLLRAWLGRSLHPDMGYESVSLCCAKLPPYSPDMNPIENVWAMLNVRLEGTKPGGWETEKAFRARVRNAVAWVNARRDGALTRMISSMPRRVKACVQAKGALTPY